jgi:hypothetical protein
MAQQLPSVMVTVYGQPKKKKTSDLLAAFPNALFVGVPSALTLVAQNELGYTPAVHPTPPQTLVQLVQLLEDFAYNPEKAQQYGAIVIDDASHLCKRSMLEWEKEAGRNKFLPYQMLNKHLLHISGLARHLGVHMAMTFHERMPGTNADGLLCPGGPEVPSRNQVQAIPSWCDLNVRAMVDPTYPDPWFPGVYYCDPTDPEWVTGDRLGVCSRKTPGNLREILRASNSGYQLARIPGLEWQDDIAETLAQAIASGQNVKEAIVEVTQTITDANPLHLRWACQDGIARGVLRKQRSKSLFDFTSGKDESQGSNAALSSTLPPPPPTS